MADERWLPVPGLEGRYEVSDLGRARSLRFRYGARPAPRMLTLCNGPKGYVVVHFAGQSRRLSRLVLLAFRGPPPPGTTEARHLDGNRKNNGLANLEWSDHRTNEADKVRHGTLIYGEAHRMSKLRREQAVAIRMACAAGETYASIGRRFGVSRRQVGRIATGFSWRQALPVSAEVAP